MEWLELCIEYKCEVIQSPANTSHFLQPCDNAVNKNIQRTVRTTRDELCAMAFIDTRSKQVTLMAGVTGHESITVRDIKTSFQATGLFPMEFNFAERCKRMSDELKEKKVLIHKRLETCTVATRLPAVQSRRATTTLKRLGTCRWQQC